RSPDRIEPGRWGSGRIGMYRRQRRRGQPTACDVTTGRPDLGRPGERGRLPEQGRAREHRVLDARLRTIYDEVLRRNPGELEFHQAVHEVLGSLAPVVAKHPHYVDAAVIRR